LPQILMQTAVQKCR